MGVHFYGRFVDRIKKYEEKELNTSIAHPDVSDNDEITGPLEPLDTTVEMISLRCQQFVGTLVGFADASFVRLRLQ